MTQTVGKFRPKEVLGKNLLIRSNELHCRTHSSLLRTKEKGS